MATSKVPEPAHTLADAAAAVARIRRRRARHDPDLDAYPRHDPADDDDVDEAVVYLHTHRRVPDRVRREEASDRALLLSYRRQRDERRHDVLMLAFYDAAVEVGAWPSDYGRQLGISSANRWHRHRQLQERVRGHELPPTRLEQEREDRVGEWVREHRARMLGLAGDLVDHRDHLIELAAEARRVDVAEAVDTAGRLLGQPGLSLAAAVAHASWLLSPDRRAVVSPDPTVRDLLARAARFDQSYRAATE